MKKKRTYLITYALPHMNSVNPLKWDRQHQSQRLASMLAGEIQEASAGEKMHAPSTTVSAYHRRGSKMATSVALLFGKTIALPVEPCLM
jgi:hypothetical protein